MIDGVKVVPLVAHVDDRGYLVEILRATDPHFSKFGRVYLVGNMAQGTVRVPPDSFGYAWEVKGR
jgi:dTDP-4-dehydrorhamnose 3,5-epimerase-like enzyme